MQISTRPITILGFARLAIYGIFLNYYSFYILRGSFIPYGTPIFYGVAIACVLATIFQEKVSFSNEIICWIVYTVLSLVTAVFAINMQTAFDGIGEFIRRTVLIMMIAYICEKDGSVKFAIRVLAVTAVACAASCLIMNTDISKKLELESGASVSTNDIGSIMAFGCFAVLFAFGLKQHKGIIKTAIKIGYIIAAVSVVFIAGSRKSILAILILFGLIFLLCGRDFLKNISLLQFVLVLLLIVGAVIFVYYYLLPNVESTNMYIRIWGRNAEDTAESDQGRLDLYSQALQEFGDHIICGMGFNNFSVTHGNYTHSTYVEPLACSGIIGFLYLAPYVMILVKQIKLIRLYRDNIEERIWQKELLAFYISFLFVGIGIPYIYKDIPCIILGMFIASQKISFDKLKEKSTEQVAEGVIHEPVPNESIATFSRF